MHGSDTIQGLWHDKLFIKNAVQQKLASHSGVAICDHNTVTIPAIITVVM